MEPANLLHSIGTVARATGLSPDTIRVWERRYGRPRPVRLDSGHRRYTDPELRWLRRVSEALSLGVRAGVAVLASEAELDRLLGDSDADGLEGEVQPLLDAVEAFDPDSLRRQLQRAYQSEGALRFFDRYLGPLLRMIGQRWAAGEFGIRHEHFATDVCSDMLRTWRLASETPDSGGILLTLLESEMHTLGLHMAALMCAIHDVRPLILGCATPTDEIARTATALECSAIALSVSVGNSGPNTTAELRRLRGRVGDNVELIVGGAGAKRAARGVGGVQVIDDFAAFDRWLQATYSVASATRDA